MELRNLFAIVLFNIVINSISCHSNDPNIIDDEIDESYMETTVKMITVETTTQEVIIITDIPQSDVDAALNLDVGEYTTQVFDYANFIFEKIPNHEICYQHYMKCIWDQGVATPVCAVNDPFEIPNGYITYGSICDVHLDNCRRLRHFWRILDYGKCVHYSELHATIVETKRRSGVEKPWKFIFYVLGSEDISSKFKFRIKKP